MSSLYVRIMTGFYAHRKTVKLRIMLKDDAFWIVPRLWAYAAENQPDGDMSKYSSEELAMLLGCQRYAKVMLQALKECGFIEENGFIHDWNEHNGYHNKFSERAKKAAEARWSKSPRPPKEEEEIESGKGKVETSIAKPMLQASNGVPESLEQVKLCCAKAGLPDSDAEWFWNKGIGCGWTNGGNKIKSWPHTIAAWKAGGYFPSQKINKYGLNSKPNPRNAGVNVDFAALGRETAEVVKRRQLERDAKQEQHEAP